MDSENSDGTLETKNNVEGFLAAISEQQRAQENRRGLSGRFLRAQDEKRRRIADTLHDCMGRMFVLKMKLDELTELKHLTPKSRFLVSQSDELIELLWKELRAISDSIYPPLLDEIGLACALRDLARTLSRDYRIETNLQIDDDLGRFPSNVEISIYRIIEESLTNICRHSGSPTARIRIQRCPTELLIAIEDDGSGIPIEKHIIGAGVGLDEMRERARHLHGTLDVKFDGKGVAVVVRLPLVDEPKAATNSREVGNTAILSNQFG